MKDEKKEENFFPCLLNEQMGHIAAEVEHIIKYNYVENIRNAGREKFGEAGSTQRISRLFRRIKDDPKNVALLREINNAEKELIAFLYNEPEALSEEQIYDYWDSYMSAYGAEWEENALHYVLELIDAESNELYKKLGIYSNITALENAYEAAFQKLEDERRDMEKKERLIISAYHEILDRWYSDIKPEQIFGNFRGYHDSKAVEIELEIDSPYMCMFKTEHLEKTIHGFAYKDTKTNHEIIKAQFDIQHAYEVLELLDCCLWGADSRPAIKTIQGKAKAWSEKYDAELIRISHDALTFKCRKLTDEEVDLLFNEIRELGAESNWRGGFERLRDIIKKEQLFSVWWD